MTPEEKFKIYQEEKARLEGSAPPPVVPPPKIPRSGMTQRTRNNLRAAIVIGSVMLGLLALGPLTILIYGPDPPPRSEPVDTLRSDQASMLVNVLRIHRLEKDAARAAKTCDVVNYKRDLKLITAAEHAALLQICGYAISGDWDRMGQVMAHYGTRP